MNGHALKLLHTNLGQHVCQRFILGVDGLSRAGKSTFVETLGQKLIANQQSVYVFHIDQHIVVRRRRYDTGCEEWYEYYNLQWDVEFLREHLFAKLRHQDQLNIPFYNDEIDELVPRTVFIPPICIVTVEGVFLPRKEWREFFDFVVYLDCLRETRFERESASTRDKIDKFRTRYWKAEDHYLDSVRPIANADMNISS